MKLIDAPCTKAFFRLLTSLSPAMRAIALVLFSVAPAWICHGAETASELAKNLVRPPASARPWVYWFPLDGHSPSNRITLDLEARQRVGIGGVLYMETEQGTPKGRRSSAGRCGTRPDCRSWPAWSSTPVAPRIAP